jgi:hypothetical protein
MKSLMRVSRAAFGALVLGFCVAPSCKALPASETMVILQTDLSLPKDVDKVTIEVLVRGDRRHFNTFEKLGNEDSLKIPASIGLTLDDGTEASTPVTFRVTAFQGPKARVLREVVTTIPKDRLVALRLPIQWLCWDQVTADADGNPQSTCPAEQTCIAGTCADKTVDPTTLEDYSADKVFGGGTGTNNDGACFDTSACFAGSKDAPVSADCTIDAGADMNVAIRVSSAGICGAEGCFVPLDGKSDSGWKTGESGKIQLPAAVCQRIKDGKAAGVSIVASSSACPLKTDALPTCGPWSSAGKAPPEPAKVGPVMLAGGQVQPWSIAVAAKSVYWTIAGSFDDRNGFVRSIPVEGGSPSEVEKLQAYPRDIALAADTTGKLTDVIWASAGVTPPGKVSEGATVTDRNVSVASTPQDVKLKLDLPLGAPEGVAVNAAGLFFTDFGANAVYRVGTQGMTPLAGATSATPPNKPYRIALDKSNAFWTNEGSPTKNDGSITLCNFSDPANLVLSSLVTGQDIPRNLVLDIDEATALATAVYWTNYGSTSAESEVQMVTLADPTSVKTLATGHKPVGIAVDKDAVYWTNQDDNTVVKRTKADGKLHTLAAKQNLPGGIALDEGYVYWINQGTSDNPGSIMRVAKDAPDAK